MISRSEILKKRDLEYPLTTELEVNLSDLLKKVNKFRDIYGKPLVITSGYRPGKYNRDAGGAPNSTHLTCQAIDVADSDGSLAAWCQANVQVLEQCELWMEDPGHTPGWVHLQTRPTKSRIFVP